MGTWQIIQYVLGGHERSKCFHVCTQIRSPSFRSLEILSRLRFSGSYCRCYISRPLNIIIPPPRISNAFIANSALLLILEVISNSLRMIFFLPGLAPGLAYFPIISLFIDMLCSYLKFPQLQGMCYFQFWCGNHSFYKHLLSAYYKCSGGVRYERQGYK